MEAVVAGTARSPVVAGRDVVGIAAGAARRPTLDTAAPDPRVSLVPNPDARRWLDHPEGYGLVSRTLHWLMAALFAWHFAGASLFMVIPDSPVTHFVGGTHFTMGFTLFVLLLLRGLWGLTNFRRRPGHPGALGRAAVAGHLALYGLMAVIPALALLRQYGSGRPFEPYGIPLMPGFAGRVDWMMAPGNTLHSLLGWVLMAMIGGHVAMSLVHRYVLREDVLGGMTRGRRQEVPPATGRGAALASPVPRPNQ